jgi:hypothetical protein
LEILKEVMMGEITLYLKVWLHKIVDLFWKKEYIKNQPAPAMMKRETVARYGRKYRCNVLIETGTYLGEMIEYQARNFSKIYSIEIADRLYSFSSKRLKKYENIRVEKGDSSIALKRVVRQLSANDKVLFWLDGHYSGGNTGCGERECPIFDELAAILSERDNKDIILIDDARCFDGTGDYPTLEEVRSFITDKAEGSEMEVNEDIIRIVLKS